MTGMAPPRRPVGCVCDWIDHPCGGEILMMPSMTCLIGQHRAWRVEYEQQALTDGPLTPPDGRNEQR